MAKTPAPNEGTTPKNVFRIFYAWQSDLPEATNRMAIRKVLRGLRTLLERDFSHLSLDVEVDEATRDEPGSPNIPMTILAKIAKNQIFVGDVSLVNQGVGTDPKKMPNPNVLFELGYAVAHLGWSRIVLLFNKSFGAPEDLPFDIDRQRVSVYRLEKTSDDSSALQSLCESALKMIISRNPAKPTDVFDEESTKRARDLRALKLLLQAVHWPIVEQHLRNAPKRISDEVLYFWEGFDGTRHSAAFHLYDKKLLKLIDAFGKHWHETVRFGDRYYAARRSGYSVFTFSENQKQRKLEERDWKYLEQEISKLRGSMRDLLDYLRQNYVEIDLDALSEGAWNDYQQFMADS